ncbi:MAG: TVP38/TMEM64 family protein [Acaryochloris sp. SU_5_25]|nr:TVP38/TMEM64 family protein [Acaryochloris sp. SU_5_25]
MIVGDGQRLKFVLIGVVTFWVMTAAPAWAADGGGFNPQQLLREVLEAIKGLGSGGAIAFIGIYILATVAFFPGSILTLGAGFVFGVVQGSILVFIGATIGATLAFLLGRYVARDWVAEKIAGNPKFAALDRAIGRAGFKIVLLTRLSPVFLLNSKYK